MAEITAAGYTQLRVGSPVNTWWIELRDGNGDPVPLAAGGSTVNRLSGDDGRVIVADDPGTQTLTFTVALTAGDVGAEPGSPVTIEGSVLFAAASGGSALTEVEAFDPVVLSAAEDVVTIRHHVEVPEQVN
ncbi:MAG TPA: hypothetical protein VKZ67_09535 [Natronosporangium sp.]|nr:hypothetical protein [Natronosporangium sp.]